MTERHLGAGVFAEFLATFLFVVFGVGGVLSILGGATALMSEHILPIALTHGLAIYLLVSVFGGVSGGHVNPAVTFGMLCIGEISGKRAFLYMIAQFSGAIFGSLMLVGFVPDALQSGLGMHSLNPNTSTLSAFFLEALISMVLVLTVFMTAVKKNVFSVIAPLAIGMAVFVGIMFTIRLTGGSMNPARSMGPVIASLLSGSSIPPHQWIYLVGPGVGALLAAIIFGRCFRDA